MAIARACRGSDAIKTMSAPVTAAAYSETKYNRFRRQPSAMRSSSCGFVNWDLAAGEHRYLGFIDIDAGNAMPARAKHAAETSPT
jgi:hypothetical protein